MDDLNKNNSQNEFDELLKKITAETNSKRVTADVQKPSTTEFEDFKPEEPEKISKSNTKFEVNISNEELLSIPDIDVDEFEGSDSDDFSDNYYGDNSPTRRIDIADVKKEIQKEKSAKTSRSIVYALCVILVSVLLSVVIINSARDIFGLAKPDTEYLVNVEQETKVSQIAKLLKKTGVINSAGMFKFYANLRYDVDSFKDGEYFLNSKMSYDEIIIALAKGNNEVQTVTVTIPEGYNINQVAELLEENGVCNANAFREACKETYGFAFEEGIPNDSTFYRLEGYIFPNTHEFYVGEAPKSVVKRFLRDFQTNVMTPKLTERMEEMGMTLHETLALASIIQKEASELDDMYVVSSIFHNRLKDDHIFPKLQSDVTYYYAQDEILPYMDIKNQAMLDAYNTYECNGLPAGAITNPGIDAIKAALYPDETSYYYFVGVTIESNGSSYEKFYFASTMSAHENNIYRASKEGKAHGTSTQ